MLRLPCKIPSRLLLRRNRLAEKTAQEFGTFVLLAGCGWRARFVPEALDNVECESLCSEEPAASRTFESVIFRIMVRLLGCVSLANVQ